MKDADYYKRDGNRYPRVTSITGQFDKSGPLTSWAANSACDYILDEINVRTTEDGGEWIEPGDLWPIIEAARKEFRRVSTKALDIGSAVHTAIEHYLKTGQEPPNPSEQILSAFLAFLEWADEYQLNPLQTEMTLFGNGYAGTCDVVAWIKLNGEPRRYLIDFKTSKKPYRNKPYNEWGWQLAAYRACLPDVEGAGVLRLDKETGYPDWYDLSENYDDDLKVFLALKDVWWARHPNFK